MTQQHATAPMVPRTLAVPKPASSCPTCLSWAVLYGGYCRACYDFRRRHPSACCAGCRRDVPLKKNYCRLCWLQAALQAANPPVVTEADLAGVTHHQLAFAGTTKDARSSLRRTPTRSAATSHGEPRVHGCLQMRRWWAVAAASTRTRASLRWAAHAEPANPALVRMRQMAQVMSQAQSWNTKLVAELNRALVVLLSGHADDQQLRYSQLVDVLHRYGVSITRVAEVLSRGGLLDDDRVPAFESWLRTSSLTWHPTSPATCAPGSAPCNTAGRAATPATPTPCAATCAPSIRC